MRLAIIALLSMLTMSVFANTPITGGYQEKNRNALAGRSFNVFLDQQLDPFGESSVFIFGALNTYETDGDPVTFYFGGMLNRTFGREFLETGVFASATVDMFRPSGGSCFGCPFQAGQSETVGSITLMWTDNRNVMVDVVTDDYGTETMEFEAAYMTEPLEQISVGDWGMYIIQIGGGDGYQEDVEFEYVDDYGLQDVIPLYEPDQPFYQTSDQDRAWTIWKSADGNYYAKQIIRSFGNGHYTQFQDMYQLLITEDLIVGYGIDTCYEQPAEGDECSVFTDYTDEELSHARFILKRDRQRWQCDPLSPDYETGPFGDPVEVPCDLVEQNLELP